MRSLKFSLHNSQFLTTQITTFNYTIYTDFNYIVYNFNYTIYIFQTTQFTTFNYTIYIFSECVARVPVSLWGSGGWGCVRSTLRNRSQPSATVCNRSQVTSSAKGSLLEVSTTSRWFVSRGRRGTLWHSDVFHNLLKVVLCGRFNTFGSFAEDVLQFSWQAQHFGRVHLHFVWQAQHFRGLVLRGFCESHCQGCVQWWQGANSVAGVAFCEICWKLTKASHETSILR